MRESMVWNIWKITLTMLQVKYSFAIQTNFSIRYTKPPLEKLNMIVRVNHNMKMCCQSIIGDGCCNTIGESNIGREHI